MDDLFLLDYAPLKSQLCHLNREQIVFITVLHVKKYLVEPVKRKQLERGRSLHDYNSGMIFFPQ